VISWWNAAPEVPVLPRLPDIFFSWVSDSPLAAASAVELYWLAIALVGLWPGMGLRSHND